MKDFLNQTLNVGDKVIFIRPSYREYTKGKIVAFTAKNIRVVYVDANGEPKKSWRQGEFEEILQAPYQLIKYDL